MGVSKMETTISLHAKMVHQLILLVQRTLASHVQLQAKGCSHLFGELVSKTTIVQPDFALLNRVVALLLASEYATLRHMQDAMRVIHVLLMIKFMTLQVIDQICRGIPTIAI
jgi:hypothetical protein